MSAATAVKHQLFDREIMPYRKQLYASAYKMTRSSAEAEDLLQETLLKAYLHFERFVVGTNARAWLYKIMTNTFINRINRSKRETFLSSFEQERLSEVPTSQRCIDSGSWSDESELYFYTLNDELREAVESIPDDFRQVVLYADVDDLSYKEIAQRLRCPIGTVMSRLHRGRKLMRKHLECSGLQRDAFAA